jgi:hypothetical protein
VFLGCFEETEMVFECLYCRFCDHDVYFSFNGVQGDWVMCGVGGKYRDGVAWGESINSSFVCIGISDIVRRI